ncbi:hypothetical protein PVAP13_3NG192000 [Panicum virgatum]|uniref:BTB domain-containing protein n=1 Tax=Panicum virgatum TaxID=38727 RepID=A0A8T0UE73_PANVG|nr:hypothetical protein PVAP13_3NG192000 [Panicum virgatum]
MKEMKHTWSLQSEAVRAVHLIKIHGLDGLHRAGFRRRQSMYFVKSTWNVDGYDWEVRLYPSHVDGSSLSSYNVALKLIFLGEAGGIDVTANLTCRLVDPSGALQPSAEKITATTSFRRPSDSSESLRLMSLGDVFGSAIPVPSSNLPQHLGQLLESHAGADVTFAVSRESFAAHKNILAARSPEKTSRRVESQEMEPSVFGALLRFIYTDVVPEFDKKMEPATATLAQHLLVAADRYGLDRLKAMCERRLAAARLKARCVEFITGESRKTLDAVMETQGFKDLMVNSPSLLAELLVAAHGNGRKN